MTRWLIPVVILLVAIAGFWHLKSSKPETGTITIEEKSWIVETVSVEFDQYTPTITLYGVTESPKLTKLSSGITAEVQLVQAVEGQTVEKGDILIALDETDARLTLKQRAAEVLEIEAQIKALRTHHNFDLVALEKEKILLELTNRELQRASELVQSQVGSQSQFDIALQNKTRQLLAVEDRKMKIGNFYNQLEQLQAKQVQAKSRSEFAAAELSRSTVRAPFSGKVAEILVSPGDRVSAGDLLIRLYDSTQIEIRAQIPTKHIKKIRESLHDSKFLLATVQIDGATLGGNLSRLSAEVKPNSGGVDAFFGIRPGKDWLQIGRTVEFTVDLPIEYATAVPPDSLYDNNQVFKVTGNELVSVNIEIVGYLKEPDGKSRMLVRSSELTNGDQILATQLPTAIEGLNVRTRDD